MDKDSLLSLLRNQQLLERLAFVAVIVVLFLVASQAQQDRASVTGEVALLTAEMEQRADRLAAVEEELVLTQKELLKLQREPMAAEQVEQEAIPTQPLLISWFVDGRTLSAEEYNAEEIAERNLLLEDLELQYIRADDESKDEVREEIRVIEREIREFKVGDPRYVFDGLHIAVENPNADAVDTTYVVCWKDLDCRAVYYKDTFTIPAYANQSYQLPVEIPSTRVIDKKQLVLSFMLFSTERTFLDEEYVILRPDLTQ